MAKIGSQVMLCVAVAALLAGCGGTTTSNTSPTGSDRTVAVQIALNSPTVNLAPGGTFKFEATVSGSSNKKVNWIVDPENGTISPNGEYIAPKKPGTYRVSASAAVDSNVRAEATIKVQDGINLTLAPQNPTLKLGDDMKFVATVSGSENSGVTYAIETESKDAGTMTPDGTYTAPDVPGTYTIVAKGVADPTRLATTKVSVIPGAEMRIRFPKTELVCLPGSTLNLDARIVGSTQRGFKWEIKEGEIGGTIDPVKFVYTAGKTPGKFTLVATGTGEKSAKAEVTVRVVPDAQCVITLAGDRGQLVVDLNPVLAPGLCAQFVTLVNRGDLSGLKIGSPSEGFVVFSPASPVATQIIEDSKMEAKAGCFLFLLTGEKNTETQFAPMIVLDPKPELSKQGVGFGVLTNGSLAVAQKLGVGDSILSAVIEE